MRYIKIMARLADRIAENVPGEFYVDSSCIDCDTCRTLAPQTFGDAPGQACVVHQPADAEAEKRALMALVSCPTSSIGSVHKRDPRAAIAALPEAIDDGVYFCGWSSPDSYGATSYLLRRPEGNWLIDSPRASKPLLSRLEELGGVTAMFLTHRDDVADHEVFAQRFGCRRIIHHADAGIDAEQILDGDAAISLGPGLTAIPVPGHTRGSTALLVDDRWLFTGDHLWWEDRLSMSRSVCWHSWPKQVKSLERLLEYRFEWVLPGHGRRWRAPSAEAMRAEIQRLLLEVTR
jgi:glyoxylase-like metal-dependent hydrolase (beta-lactamase superfamily II)/ferredoxin